MFCDRLRITRISRGYTQQFICDMTYIAMRTYQRYEGGQSEPSLSSLTILAEFLNVPVDFLLERDQYIKDNGIKVDISLRCFPRRHSGRSHR